MPPRACGAAGTSGARGARRPQPYPRAARPEPALPPEPAVPARARGATGTSGAGGRARAAARTRGAARIAPPEPPAPPAACGVVIPAARARKKGRSQEGTSEHQRNSSELNHRQSPCRPPRAYKHI